VINQLEQAFTGGREQASSSGAASAWVGNELTR